MAPGAPCGAVLYFLTRSFAPHRGRRGAYRCSRRGHEHPQGWEQGEHHSTDPRTAENARTAGASGATERAVYETVSEAEAVPEAEAEGEVASEAVSGTEAVPEALRLELYLKLCLKLYPKLCS